MSQKAVSDTFSTFFTNSNALMKCSKSDPGTLQQMIRISTFYQIKWHVSSTFKNIFKSFFCNVYDQEKRYFHVLCYLGML